MLEVSVGTAVVYYALVFTAVFHIASLIALLSKLIKK